MINSPCNGDNSPCNGPESAKTVSVDVHDVNGGNRSGNPKWLLIAHVTVINSLCNGPELAKTASVDDQDVSAPWGSSLVEIAPGNQNGD